MNIIIFTSKDHLYANYILKHLFAIGAFKNHTVSIFEQDRLVPGLGFKAGLLRYLKTSGTYYVCIQAFKQKIFILFREITAMLGIRSAAAYPYYRILTPDTPRQLLNNLRSTSSQEQIRTIAPDLILSLYSKEIIPSEILSIPRLGCINLHPAPLPLFKGVSPTFWCLAKGADYSGATLHRMQKEIDNGGILSREIIPTDDIKSEHALYLKCSQAGIKQVINFLQNPSLTDIPAFESLQSYYSLPTREAIGQFRRRRFRFFTLRELLLLLLPE